MLVYPAFFSFSQLHILQHFQTIEMAGGRYRNCTKVSLECPIDAQLYGYAPNLAANLFFTLFFGVATIIQLIVGIRHRTWFFMAVVSFGCLSECVGYAGRVIMHYNVWNDIGFNMQIDCLIQGPAYYSAGIYLTLKHIVLNIDPKYSRVKAAWYTWIFISGDAISLCVQAVGGGIAAANKGKLLSTGTDIMIGGIVFQVVVLIIFGYLLLEYFTRVLRHRSELSLQALATIESHQFRWFMGAIVVAFLAIFIRCTYRIPELLEGWGSPLMREELPFIILEGVMICISTIALTLFHPAWFFPVMASSPIARK